MTECFSVTNNGKTYECTRTVTGANALRQTINVNGLGSKEDPASYGLKGHPISSMESTARLIAHEIIRESGNRSN